jgi:glycogen(starch) synthase
MKILLIGPRPPPHGGISVHVSEIHRQLLAAGVRSAILDTSQIGSRFRFAMKLTRYAALGWTLQVHTNGHNRNSWMLALLCGIAGQWSRGSILTLHSGMMPAYVSSGPPRRKWLAGIVCRLYSRVVCVGPQLRDAAIALGMPRKRTEIAPAYLVAASPSVTLEPQLSAWIEQHRPVLSTALFFRPEYGFELLIEGLIEFRRRHAAVGCLVMGSGEQHAQAVERVRETGLENNVLLLGDVDHSTCLALMSRSHVFVRATLEDGDSTSVREALALGVPVVASHVGSRPPGTILFRSGDVHDLLSKIDMVCERATA